MGLLTDLQRDLPTPFSVLERGGSPHQLGLREREAEGLTPKDDGGWNRAEHAKFIIKFPTRKISPPL